MQQVKISLEHEQLEFLNQFNLYGFRDKSALVREAIKRLRSEFEKQQLRLSAELYAELYDEDMDLAELTEAALEGWPT